MIRKIHLSDSFTCGKMLRFALPSVVMNVFTSLYSVVDGFFVANYAGTTELAAVNLIMPVLNILGTVGYMFGVGGSARGARSARVRRPGSGHLSRIKRVPSRPAKKRISWYSTKTCLRHRKKAFPTTSLQRCILPGRK